MFKNDGSKPLTWDVQLRCYRFSRNRAVFQDLLVNLFNNLRGVHPLGSSTTRRNTGGKITTFKLGHPFFDSGIQWWNPTNVSFRVEWNSFGAFPCYKKKTLCEFASRRCWNRARYLTYFLSAFVTKKTCNSAHGQAPLSKDTIDSVLRLRKIGRSKDLSVTQIKTEIRNVTMEQI